MCGRCRWISDLWKLVSGTGYWVPLLNNSVKKEHNNFAPRMDRKLYILYLTVFIDLVGFGIVIPILPIYATELGASSLMVGLIMAVYALMNFIFSPFWGSLSDKHGRRPVIAGTVLITAMAFLLLANAHTIAVLLLARAMAGVGSANIATSQAYITDVTERENRAKALGMIGAAFGLGFIFGPPIGGFAPVPCVVSSGGTQAALARRGRAAASHETARERKREK